MVMFFPREAFMFFLPATGCTIHQVELIRGNDVRSYNFSRMGRAFRRGEIGPVYEMPSAEAASAVGGLTMGARHARRIPPSRFVAFHPRPAQPFLSDTDIRLIEAADCDTCQWLLRQVRSGEYDKPFVIDDGTTRSLAFLAVADPEHHEPETRALAGLHPGDDGFSAVLPAPAAILMLAWGRAAGFCLPPCGVGEDHRGRDRPTRDRCSDEFRCR